MSKRMLIDAAHAEETRVAVIDGTRVEEFDFESSAKKQLRGNIYLAKVTRVEPSLQAAFIEYGGNRHGFLSFNEIHPDYYQIPVADREALMREEAEEEHEHHHGHAKDHGEDEDGESAHEDDDDVMDEEVERRRRRLMRRYKIQEVIRRRQIMLVQVVKEERGNKGAALTTYLSLAGRYGVLMPNTGRGGGISRKITTATDRKRLKTVVQGLDVPEGMGLIIRTAGAKRTKLEIKRDYEYLMRLWENIRETTLHSIAPALIYEEEDLVKRAIRDMYDKDLDGVWVEGEDGFKEAREFMRMLMPAQAKKVQHYNDPTPLFVRAKVEDHLSQIYSPVVPLKSGGYLVINQTEALVAIDVNSGRATKERNIEATALKTNMEAAEEACRQLRLRDLAGLIVIDFIDMDEAKNNRAVEKKVKDCLSLDRARVQMGKISSFGLMEISRQRRRTGVLEGTTHICEHCQGTGRVRSTESSALAALRAVELEAARNGGGAVTLRVPQAVGLYILNSKRGYLERLRGTHGLAVTVLVDDDLPHAEHEIDRTESVEFERTPEKDFGFTAIAADDDEDDDADDEVLEDEEDEDGVEREDTDDDDASERLARHDGERGRGRGRRRRRGRGRDREFEGEERVAAEGEEDDSEDSEDGEAEAGFDREDSDGFGRRRRRRGRRGGRRPREDGRGDDPYMWTRPRVPDGDPYIWMDPLAPRAPANDHAPRAEQNASEAGEAREPREPREGRGRDRGRRRGRGGDRREMNESQAREAAPEAAHLDSPVPQVANGEAPAPVAASGDEVDIWVELPAAEPEPPKTRARRSRSRKPKDEAQAEPAAEASPAETPAPEAELEPTPEPEPQAEPSPVVAAAEPETTPDPAPRELDPNEITAPPAQPKRGWWRRG